MFFIENNNSGSDSSDPCCNCTPCLPCFNPNGGCCYPSGPLSDPRICDPRCDPCAAMTGCGACMIPWIEGRGDSIPPDSRNVCILPSPQPVCNPESKYPIPITFPLNPPPPESEDEPPPPVVEEVPKTQTKTTMTVKKKPKPYLICPYYYPCPYPCSCCSGYTTPFYQPYSIGCPSTCMPCMSPNGMPVTPIPLPLPFGKAPRIFGCRPGTCVKKSKKSVALPAVKAVSTGNFSTNNSSPAKDTSQQEQQEQQQQQRRKTLQSEQLQRRKTLQSEQMQRRKTLQSDLMLRRQSEKRKSVFNLKIDPDEIDEFADTLTNPSCPPYCCPPLCSCTRCVPIQEWTLCRQRKMKFAFKGNKFCCGPKICNHVGCFDKPVRNTVAFVSDMTQRCYHPFVLQ